MSCINTSYVASPSVLEEKCSKNEHDAAPLGLSFATSKDHEYGNKETQDLRIPVDPGSSDDLAFANGKADNSDFVDDDELSEEITVVTALSVPFCSFLVCLHLFSYS